MTVRKPLVTVIWILAIFQAAANFVSAQSITELEQRAKAGDAVSMRELALDYGKGIGVPKNKDRWLYWNQKAAQHGDADAMADLGSWYLVGVYVPQDFSRAFFWLHKAADRGSPLAMSNLGEMYETGNGVPVDYSEAYFWLDLATANPAPGVKFDELRRERDEAALKLSPSMLASVQERAAKWIDAHSSAPKEDHAK